MNDARDVWVLDYRVPEALAALEKLAAKARRYGCDDVAVTVGETIKEKGHYRDWDGEERAITVYLTRLSVTGVAPRIGNHEFLARIELDEGGNLVDAVPGVEDLDRRFRDSDGTCEHCNKKRRRAEVYAVRNLDDGRQLAVGSNCLRDYLGIDDPAKIARRFALLRGIGGIDEDERGHRLKPRWNQSLEGLLILAAVCVRLFGWCSKAQAQADDRLTSTSSYVYTMLFPGTRPTKADLELMAKIEAAISDDDRETAQATIRWVRDELTGDSDYVQNLRTIFSRDDIRDEKRIGLAVSAIAGYHRAKELELRKTKDREAAAHSQHVGNEGDRLRGLKVTLEMQRVIGANDFGDRILVKFRDEAGNTLSWITGKGCGFEIGEQLILDGTVKAHKEYNGNAETNLTRCKVHEIEKEKADA